MVMLDQPGPLTVRTRFFASSEKNPAAASESIIRGLNRGHDVHPHAVQAYEEHLLPRGLRPVQRSPEGAMKKSTVSRVAIDRKGWRGLMGRASNGVNSIQLAPRKMLSRRTTRHDRLQSAETNVRHGSITELWHDIPTVPVGEVIADFFFAVTP